MMGTTVDRPFLDRPARIKGKIMKVKIVSAAEDSSADVKRQPTNNKSGMVYVRIHVTHFWDVEDREWLGILRFNYQTEAAICIQRRDGEPNYTGWNIVYNLVGWNPFEEKPPVGKEITAEVTEEFWNGRSKFRAKLLWPNGDVRQGQEQP